VRKIVSQQIFWRYLIERDYGIVPEFKMSHRDTTCRRGVINNKTDRVLLDRLYRLAPSSSIKLDLACASDDLEYNKNCWISLARVISVNEQQDVVESAYRYNSLNIIKYFESHLDDYDTFNAAIFGAIAGGHITLFDKLDKKESLDRRMSNYFSPRTDNLAMLEHLYIRYPQFPTIEFVDFEKICEDGNIETIKKYLMIYGNSTDRIGSIMYGLEGASRYGRIDVLDMILKSLDSWYQMTASDWKSLLDCAFQSYETETFDWLVKKSGWIVKDGEFKIRNF
jgi:hypothetical protein